MNLQEILSLNIENKVVYIIGRPGSGKTWLSDQFINGGTYVFHTDDFIKVNPDYLYRVVIKDADELSKRYGRGCIIEGMECYNLLIRGYKEGVLRPDIIIDCVISAGKQREIYLAERNPEKLKWQKKFYEQKLTMLNEYFKLIRGLPEIERPQFITYNNTFDAVEK